MNINAKIEVEGNRHELELNQYLSCSCFFFPPSLLIVHLSHCLTIHIYHELGVFEYKAINLKFNLSIQCANK